MTLHSVFEKSQASSLLFLMRIVSAEDDVIFHKLLLWERKENIFPLMLSLECEVRTAPSYELNSNIWSHLKLDTENFLETNNLSRSNTIVPAVILERIMLQFYSDTRHLYCIHSNGGISQYDWLRHYWAQFSMSWSLHGDWIQYSLLEVTAASGGSNTPAFQRPTPCPSSEILYQNPDYGGSVGLQNAGVFEPPDAAVSSGRLYWIIEPVWKFLIFPLLGACGRVCVCMCMN
jgi:hypothetical protein